MGPLKEEGGVAYAKQEIQDIHEMLTYAEKFGLAAEVVWSFGKHCSSGTPVSSAAIAACNDWDI